MGENNLYDVIIIGAGQCGLALGYNLDKENIPYLIIEKDRAFSSWYQRWDSFTLNTANWMNVLPGFSIFTNTESYRCYNKHQMIYYFENWLNTFSPNIKSECVTRLDEINSTWNVITTGKIYKAKMVVLAIGYNKIYIPEFQFKVSKNIKQIHSSQYLSASEINTRCVLVIGSGSSGVQICEDLAKVKRYSITLACSKNRYFSWSYLGVSVHRIAKIVNLFKLRSDSLLGRIIKALALNRGDPATPPKPKELQKKYGVRLTKRLIDIKNSVAFFEGKQQLPLDDITIIWCTGFQYNASYLFKDDLKSKLIDDNGAPLLKTDFQSNIANLYFIGLRFQRLLASHTIYGAIKDAKVLATEISNKLSGSHR